ncbi:competence/damage-inducible protein A [Kordiimonas aquimaris]|uniref:competence/damage-inducible protein A n=1 Tax=Kordiimonas aquimaris TaxID=707591 RepID=UPI0021D0D668|nr:molybdopterin-binding protein [Kordiimonas aquimaris]
MVNAALLIIGDEILSGRTQDKNIQYLATWLNEAAIQLVEVRIVPDVEAEIVAAINALREIRDYVFTTGGIGPTHDDITSASIAAAFGVSHGVDAEAYRRLSEYYGEEDFTDARKRMAMVPEGALLIDNPVSIAPGFQMENVFVLAGVPKIMQAMLEKLRDRLKGGRKVWSQSLTIHAPESKMAGALERIERDTDSVSLGSYPFFRNGNVGTQIVIRCPDKSLINQAMDALLSAVARMNFEFERPSEIA